MTKPGNGSAKQVGESQLFELLRYSHIFAAVVREILEIKLLNEVCPNCLTLSQFHLLKLISLDGKHQVGQVADYLGVSPPAATKNVDKLEGLGLVFRKQSKGDRRATLLSSSAKGRRLVEKYETLKAKRLTPVINAFSTDELDQLARWLERFSLVLLHAEDSGEDLCFRCSGYFEDKCPVTHLRDGCPFQKVCDPHAAATGEMEA